MHELGYEMVRVRPNPLRVVAKFPGLPLAVFRAIHANRNRTDLSGPMRC